MVGQSFLNSVAIFSAFT